MTSSKVQRPPSLLSKRRVGIAGVAAVLACAVCCALPLLAAVGLGSGVLATLTAAVGPGVELLVGGTVFVLVLGAIALWGRLERRSTGGCGPSCKVDGTCCERAGARDT